MTRSISLTQSSACSVSIRAPEEREADEVLEGVFGGFAVDAGHAGVAAPRRNAASTRAGIPVSA